MQCRRSHLTMRWLMVAVAVIAAILGVERMGRRWAYLRAKAAYYAEAERRVRHGWVHPKGLAYMAADPQEADRMAARKRQFERAAWRPWEAIPIDLAEPQSMYGTPRSR
jgi:hypothetical protein